MNSFFSIVVCLPHFVLVLSMTTHSTILCCLSMSSWVYLEYGSLGLYLVLIPSPGSPLSFSIYAHSMPVSFLSQTQVDFLTPQLSQVPIHWSIDIGLCVYIIGNRYSFQRCQHISLSTARKLNIEFYFLVV